MTPKPTRSTIVADDPVADVCRPAPPEGADDAAGKEDVSYLMNAAFEEAERAALRGEVPIGAVLTDGQGAILARSGNAVEVGADPCGHAEILVLRAAAAASGRPRLPGTTLYVTLEPCAMCAAAISFARVALVVFAAEDPKGGAVVNGPQFFGQPTCHHRPDVVRYDDGNRSATLLRSFFRARRKGGALAGDQWRKRTI